MEIRWENQINSLVGSKLQNEAGCDPLQMQPFFTCRPSVSQGRWHRKTSRQQIGDALWLAPLLSSVSISEVCKRAQGHPATRRPLRIRATAPIVQACYEEANKTACEPPGGQPFAQQLQQLRTAEDGCRLEVG